MSIDKVFVACRNTWRFMPYDNTFIIESYGSALSHKIPRNQDKFLVLSSNININPQGPSVLQRIITSPPNGVHPLKILFIRRESPMRTPATAPSWRRKKRRSGTNSKKTPSITRWTSSDTRKFAAPNTPENRKPGNIRTFWPKSRKQKERNNWAPSGIWWRIAPSEEDRGNC